MSRIAMLLLVFVVGCGGNKFSPNFKCDTENCEDCAVLATHLSWSAETSSKCLACQGAPEADAGTSCFQAPVRDGKHVIRGCNSDSDCRMLNASCGQYTGQPHFTCVTSDAI